MVWIALLAQDSGGGGIPVAQLGQYGIAGVILMIFLWFGWQVYKRERDRADSNEAEIKRLNTVIQEKYVPSLEQASKALVESNQLLAEFKARRRS